MQREEKLEEWWGKQAGMLEGRKVREEEKEREMKDGEKVRIQTAVKWYCEHRWNNKATLRCAL